MMVSGRVTGIGFCSLHIGSCVRCPRDKTMLGMNNFFGRLFGKSQNQVTEGPFENALVIRSDFSNDSAWVALCEEIQKPVGEFRAYVEIINDRKFHNVSAGQIGSLVKDLTNHSFLFLADTTTFASVEHPILVIDLSAEPPKMLRVIPSEVWGIENNLSIANMDFDEFSEGADDDGVFRGFPQR